MRNEFMVNSWNSCCNAEDEDDPIGCYAQDLKPHDVIFSALGKVDFY